MHYGIEARWRRDLADSHFRRRRTALSSPATSSNRRGMRSDGVWGVRCR